MPTRDDDERTSLLQGTLDLLILRMLGLGPQHGQGIARAIQHQSDEVFLVDHGSLYLALQRLEERGFVDAKWGVSDNNRRARFYKLTAKGRSRLNAKTEEWNRIAAAMGRILGTRESEA
jgi:PadR family transcriptional regulator, regulatory protein PadR